MDEPVVTVRAGLERHEVLRVDIDREAARVVDIVCRTHSLDGGRANRRAVLVDDAAADAPATCRCEVRKGEQGAQSNESR
mgnify:CR=1 FL=1